MKHLFVPYDIARQLKEKGFDEECLTVYVPYYLHPNKWHLQSINNTLLNSEIKQNDSHKLDFTGYLNSVPAHFGLKQIAAPLYQQVTDWFRDKHGIHIQNDCLSYKIAGGHFQTVESPRVFKSFYEALTKAIEEALKLI